MCLRVGAALTTKCGEWDMANSGWNGTPSTGAGARNAALHSSASQPHCAPHTPLS
jgi:hypothetical protein